MARRFSIIGIKEETGFTLIHGLMALAVIFIVGFAGWYVSRSQADPTKTGNSSTPDAQNQQKKNVDNKGFALPKDWQWYESKELGLKFAYPKVFGDITATSEFCCGLTKDDFPDVESQHKSKTSDATPIDHMSGDFFLETYKQGANEIPSRSQGPKVRKLPNEGRWVVSKTNPDDPAQYRLGMIYGEVTAHKSSGGTDVYGFKSNNKAATTYQLVFQANSRYHKLALPTLYAGEQDTNTQKAYESFRDQVIQSIGIVEQ